MSDTMISTWFELPDGLAADDVPRIIPVGNNTIEYVAGLDVLEDDLEIKAPGGAYFVRLQGNIVYPSSPPASGLVSLNVMFYYPDGSGGETSVLACGIEVNALHEAEGYGDFPFWPLSLHKPKTEVFIAPSSGRFVLETVQNTPEEPFSVSGQLLIVKI